MYVWTWRSGCSSGIVVDDSFKFCLWSSRCIHTQTPNCDDTCLLIDSFIHYFIHLLHSNKPANKPKKHNMRNHITHSYSNSSELVVVNSSKSRTRCCHRNLRRDSVRSRDSHEDWSSLPQNLHSSLRSIDFSIKSLPRELEIMDYEDNHNGSSSGFFVEDAVSARSTVTNSSAATVSKALLILGENAPESILPSQDDEEDADSVAIHEEDETRIILPASPVPQRPTMTRGSNHNNVSKRRVVGNSEAMMECCCWIRL